MPGPNGEKRRRTDVGVWPVLERMLKIASVLIIPVLIWGIRSEIRQSHFEAFMGEGPRVTPQTLEERIIRSELETREWASSIHALQPPDWREKVDRLEALAENNRDTLAGLAVQMESVRGDIRAIRLILDGSD